MEDRMYLLTIRLDGIEPEIWRRFVAPGDITLDRLHDVIQIVMGWQDYHLHTFTIGKKRYTENPESKEDGAREDRYRLVDLIKKKGITKQGTQYLLFKHLRCYKTKFFAKYQILFVRYFQKTFVFSKEIRKFS